VRDYRRELKVVKKAASSTIKDPFGPRVLRHTFGTQLCTRLRAGVDLVTVAELMGHARLDTTRIYTLPIKADWKSTLAPLVTDL